MTEKDQIELFKTLKTLHPKWTTRFISGYVHGAVLAADTVDPTLRHPSKSSGAYGKGMMLAFAVRRGMEVEGEKWFGSLGQ
jgi:hypothetical protein